MTASRPTTGDSLVSTTSAESFEAAPNGVDAQAGGGMAAQASKELQQHVDEAKTSSSLENLAVDTLSI